MVSRNDLPGTAWLAVVEQDEVLDNIQQPIMREHAVQQHLGIEIALVRLVEPLPLREVVPVAGDRAVAGMVAIRHDKEGVVMEGMSDDIVVHVVGQVVVKALTDISVDRLQFDEDERQPVDEADEIGATIVVGCAHPCDFQFTHDKESVCARRVVEVDDLDSDSRPAPSGIPVSDRHAIAKQSVEVAVVLRLGAIHVVRGQNPHSSVDNGGWQVGI